MVNVRKHIVFMDGMGGAVPLHPIVSPQPLQLVVGSSLWHCAASSAPKVSPGPQVDKNRPKTSRCFFTCNPFFAGKPACPEFPAFGGKWGSGLSTRLTWFCQWFAAVGLLYLRSKRLFLAAEIAGSIEWEILETWVVGPKTSWFLFVRVLPWSKRLHWSFEASRQENKKMMS